MLEYVFCFLWSGCNASLIGWVHKCIKVLITKGYTLGKDLGFIYSEEPLFAMSVFHTYRETHCTAFNSHVSILSRQLVSKDMVEHNCYCFSQAYR